MFVLVILVGIGSWFALRQPAPARQPYADWRNGVIVHVRNCELPADEAARLRCAALYCAQRVTERLTNPQQAKLSIDRYERDPASGVIRVEGSLDQYLRSRTLPTGFSCTMESFRRAEPKFIFGGRNLPPEERIAN